MDGFFAVLVSNRIVNKVIGIHTQWTITRHKNVQSKVEFPPSDKQRSVNIARNDILISGSRRPNGPFLLLPFFHL
jgi:hypothetical protein